MNKFILIIAIVIVLIAIIFSYTAKTGKLKYNNDNHTSIGKIVTLPKVSGSITINTGDDIKYTHAIHGSVGINYTVEFDDTAFEAYYNIKYDAPDAVEAGMCGGDSAMRTTTLTSLKKGTYTVRVIHSFRGTVEKVLTYKIIVL